MHLEFLLEEVTAEKVLDNLLPLIITGEHTYRCIKFQGKADLLKNLAAELRGYSKWIPADFKIIVLLDRDKDNCTDLKTKLNQIAEHSGLVTKSNPNHNKFQVLNRIAIEEIEAWFLGDADAMRIAYPRLTANFEKKVAYRNPDEIAETWETMERILQRSGYFKTGLRKLEAAYEISKQMQPLRNRSKSFQVFWQGITACIQN